MADPKVSTGSSALDAIGKAGGLTAADIAEAKAALTAVSGNTKTPKPTTNIYPSISSPTDATALINKVFEDQLKRPATAAEMKYWKPLLAGCKRLAVLYKSTRYQVRLVLRQLPLVLTRKYGLHSNWQTILITRRYYLILTMLQNLQLSRLQIQHCLLVSKRRLCMTMLLKQQQVTSQRLLRLKQALLTAEALRTSRMLLKQHALQQVLNYLQMKYLTLLREAYDKGLDLEKNTFNTFLDNKFKFGATSKGEAGKTISALTKVAAANGLDLQKAFGSQLPGWLSAINKGEAVETYSKIIRDVAKIGMPEKVAKLIDQGVDLDTIYSPYKNLMANTLEINPETITLNDPTLRTAITAENEVPLYQFERQLRQDNRWQYTNQARSEVADAAKKILQDFGFMG